MNSYLGDAGASIAPEERASPFGREDAAIRILDVAISVAVIACLAPLLLFTAALVFATSPGPILFAHRRLGRDGRSFPCLKYRTMAVDAEARIKELLARDPRARAEWDRDHKLRVDPRVTLVGRFLRRSSLDELPQLLNVLRGEMSMVGPRPIVAAEVPRYGRYFRDYCKVRPGITGLWQISGRNNISYRRRVALDVMYVRRRSARLYARIMLLTIPAVVAGKGSY